MHEQPDIAKLEELRRLATELLNPPPGKSVVFMVVDDEDAERIMGGPLEDEEESSNVHSLHGGPVYTGEEECALIRGETLDMLLEIAAAVERGELRDFLMVAGIENNQRLMTHVQTFVSTDATSHLPVFMGGLSLLKDHFMDTFATDIDPYAGEDYD